MNGSSRRNRRDDRDNGGMTHDSPPHSALKLRWTTLRRLDEHDLLRVYGGVTTDSQDTTKTTGTTH